jgi:hypothetical protein
MLYLLITSDDKKAPHPPLYGYHGKMNFYSLTSVLRFPKKSINKALLAQARRITTRVQDAKQGVTFIPDHTPYV